MFEFRIPILPETSFFSNLKLAALSLAKLGGSYAQAPLVISMGDVTNLDRVRSQNAWSKNFPVVWRPAPPENSDRMFSSGMDRYVEAPRGDVVILIDADACLMAPIDDLLDRLRCSERPLVSGLMAHFSPFSHNGAENDREWRALLDAFGFSHIELNCDYSEAARETAGGCPPYFNYGFVAFNQLAFTKIAPLIAPLTVRVIDYLKGRPNVFFSGQIALTLAFLTAGVETLALGPEFNCPNSDEMLPYGLEVEDIRVLHFLRKDLFDRHDFLCDPDKFAAFRSEQFTSSVIKRFQSHVLSLPDVFYIEGN